MGSKVGGQRAVLGFGIIFRVRLGFEIGLGVRLGLLLRLGLGTASALEGGNAFLAAAAFG